jgi:hypothetical protein
MVDRYRVRRPGTYTPHTGHAHAPRVSEPESEPIKDDCLMHFPAWRDGVSLIMTYASIISHVNIYCEEIRLQKVHKPAVGAAVLYIYRTR